jgi:hypothetical protein
MPSILSKYYDLYLCTESYSRAFPSYYLINGNLDCDLPSLSSICSWLRASHRLTTFATHLQLVYLETDQRRNGYITMRL